MPLIGLALTLRPSLGSGGENMQPETLCVGDAFPMESAPLGLHAHRVTCSCQNMALATANKVPPVSSELKMWKNKHTNAYQQCV